MEKCAETKMARENTQRNRRNMGGEEVLTQRESYERAHTRTEKQMVNNG